MICGCVQWLPRGGRCARPRSDVRFPKVLGFLARCTPDSVGCLTAHRSRGDSSTHASRTELTVRPTAVDSAVFSRSTMLVAMLQPPLLGRLGYIAFLLECDDGTHSQAVHWRVRRVSSAGLTNRTSLQIYDCSMSRISTPKGTMWGDDAIGAFAMRRDASRFAKIAKDFALRCRFDIEPMCPQCNGTVIRAAAFGSRVGEVNT